MLDDNSEHKKAKGVNKNIIIKDHKIGTYKINKISLSCFDDRTYFQHNGYDGLTLGYYN